MEKVITLPCIPSEIYIYDFVNQKGYVFKTKKPKKKKSPPELANK